MSGRDGEWEWEGEGMPPWLWEATLRRAMRSRRGLESLRRLEEGLLALPDKTLIHGALCRVRKDDDDQPVGEPQFCAVGAMVYNERLKKGQTKEQVIAYMSNEYRFDSDYDTYEAANQSAEEAKRTANMAYTLAWEIEMSNDAIQEDVSGEERYEQMLAWVRKAIAEHPLGGWDG